jgi:hypothetical protein
MCWRSRTLRKGIQKLMEKRFRQFVLRPSQKGVCLAFVIFNQESIKYEVLKHYYWSSSYGDVGHIFRRFQSPKIKFLNQFPLKVIQAVEPEYCLWEHLDWERPTINKRRRISFIWSLLAAMCASAILVLTGGMRKPKKLPSDPKAVWVVGTFENSLNAVEPDPDFCFSLCEVAFYPMAKCRGNPAKVKTVYDSAGTSVAKRQFAADSDGRCISKSK